jgi:LmbE family N-acetylglucosaminyl deacetylase
MSPFDPCRVAAPGYRDPVTLGPGTDGVERILAVTAHPDDVDFGASGTIATWTAAGIDVSYCIVTDGDAGGFDPAVPRSEIGGIRRNEQLEAAKAVGVDDVTFLGYPDGRVVMSLDLRRDIARQIRRVRPDRVVAQHPERNWWRIGVNHPDHLAVGEATMCAVYPDARNPFAFPELADEGLEAWTVPEVWLTGYESPDRFVDITDVFDRKIAALMAHASQMVNIDNIEELLRTWATANAERAGLPEGRLAEGFHFFATA